MTFPRARLAEEERVFVLRDEARRRQLVDEGAIHLFVEVEIEAVEAAVAVAEARQLDAAIEEAILPAHKLVGDERPDEIDRRGFLGLRLTRPRHQHVGHAGETEFAERVIQFYEVHVGSPVLRSMRSR